MFYFDAISVQRPVLIRSSFFVYLLLFYSLSISFGQTTYYVAASGDDNNTGQSSGSPFQTIAKINSLSLQPGDQVLFRRNDTFRGSLQLRQSGSSGNPIVIDAYGSGDKPVLAGSMVVSNWTNIGNNTWQADCPACGNRVTGLYRDKSALPLGRYPNLDAANKGYLSVQSHTGKTQLTSQQSLSTNWTGGEAVFRPVQWILNRSTITGQNSNTLLLNSAGTYDISDNWGFFIQNHPATLDQAGEWYYNLSTKKIQLYDNQSNPNNQTIAATAFSETITLANVSYVSIRNLQITQALSSNLLITNSSNLVIATNDIIQAGEDGLLVQGSGQQVLMENNLIEDVNNNGVTIAPYQNVAFRGNTIRRIGLIPGRGKSGDGTYVGFQSACTANTLIENNVLDNIGYNALTFSNSTIIQRNQISNFCMTKCDGSGLYIWNGNRQTMSDIHLLSNIIYNGIGASEGSPSGTHAGANGIYLDDCTTNIEVAGNSVYNCQGYGLFLHGSSNISLTGNTVYNNSEGQLSIINANGCQPRNNVIQNNIFVTRLAGQYNVKYESNQNDIGSYGQFDNNVYARPFEDTYKIYVYTGSSANHFSLAQWQNQYGKDLSSTNSPVTYTSGNPDDYIKFLANPTPSASQVSLTDTYRDARNNVYTGQITIPAFSSVVLLKDITASIPLRTADNPTNAVAGLDYNYYETFWTNLPDFTSLAAVKTGISSIPTLAVRNRDDSFGLRFTGYVSVPADGVYTFYTSSDDGSKLLIGSTEVVNNDGTHGEQERSGTIGLKAGLHAFTVVYFNGGGGRVLTVSYSGPGLTKQVIPSSALWRVNTSQPPASTLRAADNPANTVAGLDYSYYEGNWTSLPDFTSLAAVKTGVSNTPTLAVRNRDDSFGLRFTGYVNVPADGVYTFYTNSDDGSKLLIGTTEVVNNDGGHGPQERSGTIGLKAGLHAFTVVYFEINGNQALTVSYSGPGVAKKVIPASALWRGNTPPASAGTGLRAEYFNNVNLTAPVVLTRTDATVDFDWGNDSPASGSIAVDYFSARWTGQIEAPATGTYVFSTNTDDGVRLWINGNQVINDWNGHAPTTNISTPLTLNAGQRYDIRMEYFENYGGASAKLWWSYPGQPQQTVPQGRLYPAASPSARVGATQENESVDPVRIQLYPMPAQESLWIRYYAETAGEATIQLVSTSAQPVLQASHPIIAGENLIKIAVEQVSRGSYVLTLIHNQQRLSRKVILSE